MRLTTRLAARRRHQQIEELIRRFPTAKAVNADR
jgi:hypothetical protein